MRSAPTSTVTTNSCSTYFTETHSDDTLRFVKTLRTERDSSMTTNLTDRVSHDKHKRNEHLTAVFITHGECVQDRFPQWLRLAYKGGGEIYHPYDLNMPLTIPRRPRSHFINDSPLTEHGKIIAESIGRGLSHEDLLPYVIYTAPDLRSVQTATAIARALRCTYTTIRIEPSLVDWCNWRESEDSRHFLSPKNFFYLGYPIDVKYQPVLPVDDVIKRTEHPAEFYERVAEFIGRTIASCEDREVFFVGGPALAHIAKDVIINTPEQLAMAEETVEPCTVHAIIVSRGGEVTHDPAPIRKLTRTLKDAQEERTRVSTN